MSLRLNSFSSYSMPGSSGASVSPMDSKESLRGLNTRLADYLAQVRVLQEANSKLEAQIREKVSSRSTLERDWTQYDTTIDHLKEQLKELTMDNAHLMLQIDNARLAADDFKVKFEAEHAVRTGVDQDVANLRKMIDDTHMSRMQLESEIESLKEELIFLKRNHEEDVANLNGQIRGSSVDVQMDARKGDNLSETIDKIRQQYEKATQKSREETEAWYQTKFDSVSAEVIRNTETLEEGKSQVNDLRRQKQMLEIELQSLLNTNHSLEDNLKDTSGRYAREMNHHNGIIQQLEAELAEVHAQVKRQGAEYQALLNIKIKLEEEIATYHHLLEDTGVDDGIRDAGNRKGGNVNGIGTREDTKFRGIGICEDTNFRGAGTREDNNFKGAGTRDDTNIRGMGLLDDAIGKGTGTGEDKNVKGSGAHEDANSKDSGVPEDANHNGNVAEDDILEFSLEQALNAAPPVITPDQVPTISEIIEEDIVSHEEVKLNTANVIVEEKETERSGGEDAEVVEESPLESVEDKLEEVVQKKQEDAEQEAEEKQEDAGPAVEEKQEDAGPAVEEKLEDAGPAVEEKHEDAGPAVEEKLEDAGPAVEEKLEDAGPAVEEKLEDAEQAVENIHKDGGQEVEEKQDKVGEENVGLEELKTEPIQNQDEHEE